MTRVACNICRDCRPNSDARPSPPRFAPALAPGQAAEVPRAVTSPLGARAAAPAAARTPRRVPSAADRIAPLERTTRNVMGRTIDCHKY